MRAHAAAFAIAAAAAVAAAAAAAAALLLRRNHCRALLSILRVICSSWRLLQMGLCAAGAAAHQGDMCCSTAAAAAAAGAGSGFVFVLPAFLVEPSCASYQQGSAAAARAAGVLSFFFLRLWLAVCLLPLV